MDDIGILGVFCGSAALSGILLSIHFFVSKKVDVSIRLTLGLMFLAISMRIAKSVWHYVLYDFAKLGVGQGFVALTIIGPSLLFYLIHSSKRKPQRIDYLHWLWPFIAVVIAIIEPISFRFLYRYATILTAIYLAYGVWLHLNIHYESRQIQRFSKIILIGVALIIGSFIYQLTIDGLRLYTYGAAFASLSIYFLLFKALSNALVIASIGSKEVTDDVIQKVIDAFEKQKFYLKPGITLNAFAAESNIPSYLITPSVNKAYSRSFPEAINHFRVLEVKRRIQNGDHKNLKIEGLASEAGFTAPSAFYTAFKKETGVTPTQFQKAIKSS